MSRVYPCSFCNHTYHTKKAYNDHECAGHLDGSELLVGRFFCTIHTEKVKVIHIKEVFEEDNVKYCKMDGIVYTKHILTSVIDEAALTPFTSLEDYVEITQEKYNSILHEQVMKHFGKLLGVSE